MSRFSPSVPKPKTDPGKHAGAAPTSEGYRRHGSAVGPATKSGATAADPGKTAPASQTDSGFRRTGAAVGPASKERTTSGSQFQGHGKASTGTDDQVSAKMQRQKSVEQQQQEQQEEEQQSQQQQEEQQGQED